MAHDESIAYRVARPEVACGFSDRSDDDRGVCARAFRWPAFAKQVGPPTTEMHLKSRDSALARLGEVQTSNEHDQLEFTR